ncbi:MAG: hypothetical protein AAFP90_08220 [Planctomycetota bacterium]
MATIRPSGDTFVRVDRAQPPAALALQMTDHRRLPSILPSPRRQKPVSDVAVDASTDTGTDSIHQSECESGAATSQSALMLMCESRTHTIQHGAWAFTLRDAAGRMMEQAGDIDMGDLNRLALLAAVRGMEAIDGQSQITLISANNYLIRSLGSPLDRWRENDFMWNQFGQTMEVQNADLWRRIDRALNIHDVSACLISSQHVSRRRTRRPEHRAAVRSVNIAQADTRDTSLHGWLMRQSDVSPKQGRQYRIDVEHLSNIDVEHLSDDAAGNDNI